MKIWKLSHGIKSIDDQEYTKLLQNHLAIVHLETGAKGKSGTTQANFFKNAQRGDIFYLCRSNNKIELLGEFTDETIDTTKDGWYQRKYKVIATASNNNSYDGTQKWWAPNDNSTFIEVPQNKLNEFVDLILKPFFGINSIDELDSTRSKPVSDKQPLNQILYGPPGTGKTYNTIVHALYIIDGKEKTDNLEKAGRTKLKERFDNCVKLGQIVFTTFHQSYGYEEFVEGIKPVFESENIEYEIKDGVFKSLCKLASEKEGINFDEKIEWLKSECDEAEGKSLRIGNFTVTYRGKKTFRIQPDKSKHEEADYPASIVNIEKIYKGGSKKEVYNPTYVLGILEYLYTNGLKKYTDIKNTGNKPYVLIIDEINRGNISKIFGELITLIEPSKRIRADEELRVSLPHSGMGDDGEGFGVPQNLYIIGTMNTADRSIALMDTALRRRFEFVEMMPNPLLLRLDLSEQEMGCKKEEWENIQNWSFDDNASEWYFHADYPNEGNKKYKGDMIINDINLRRLLYAINKRIEFLYDRDHQIGHAYFIGVKTFDELQSVFKNKIIPLLQEYFYDDWEKIRLVLADNQTTEQNYQFVKIKAEMNQDKIKTFFGDKINGEFDFEDGKKIYGLNESAFGEMKSYIKIYEAN